MILRSELKRVFEKDVNSFVDQQILNFINFQYHSMHNKIASKNLKIIEAKNGKLSKDLKIKSDEYAHFVLGSKIYAPWLYVYSALNGEFKEGWIPDNYYGRVVVPKLQSYYGAISEFNSLNKLIFKCDKFPDLLYYANDSWIDTNYNLLTQNDVKNRLKDIRGKFVFKTDNSAQGNGVYVLNSDNFDFNFFKKKGNGIIQEYIKQNDFFNNFMSKSVATIRLTTYISDNGEPSVKACYLRFGRGNDTHIQGDSTIRIPININNGEFYEQGYINYWDEVKEHPDTKIKFKDNKIPYFEKCKQTIFELHKSIPFVKIIGWDIIINSNNEIQVMEWNGYHNGIKFTEATQGPCFKGMGLENLWKNKY